MPKLRLPSHYLLSRGQFKLYPYHNYDPKKQQSFDDGKDSRCARLLDWLWRWRQVFLLSGLGCGLTIGLFYLSIIYWFKPTDQQQQLQQLPSGTGPNSVPPAPQTLAVEDIRMETVVFVLQIIMIVIGNALLLFMLGFCVVFPLVFYHCTSFHRHLLFKNRQTKPWSDEDNFDDVQSIDLDFDVENQGPAAAAAEASTAGKLKYRQCMRNFALTSPDRLPGGGTLRIGVLHMLPHFDQLIRADDLDLSDRRRHFSFGHDPHSTVVLFAHGNTDTREQRMYAYQRLSTELGAHVVAFDYRGFGDSGVVGCARNGSDQRIRPTPEGITADTRLVYEWILAEGVDRRRVLLWGHSMGAAVLCRLLAALPVHQSPLAAVLEAPFTSMAEAVPILAPRWLTWHPLFTRCFVRPFTDNPDLNFDSVPLLPLIDCPLWILHARDDRCIPFDLGLRLATAAKRTQPLPVRDRTRFVPFKAELGLGHFDIFKYKRLVYLLRHWIRSIRDMPRVSSRIVKDSSFLNGVEEGCSKDLTFECKVEVNPELPEDELNQEVLLRNKTSDSHQATSPEDQCHSVDAGHNVGT